MPGDGVFAAGGFGRECFGCCGSQGDCGADSGGVEDYAFGELCTSRFEAEG